MTVAEAYERCRAIAKVEARNFYYGFVLLDPPRRDGIHAVYAFSRRCDDSVDGDESTEWKRAALVSRRREIDDCVRGEVDQADAVLVALADAIQRFRIPRAPFDALIDGVEMDLTTRRYPNVEALTGYCDRVAGGVGILSLHVFGFGDPRAPQHAADLGVALQIVNILRDVAEDANRDRIYLPQDEMTAHGVSDADIASGHLTPGLVALLDQQASRSRALFAEGKRLLPLLDRRSRMCVGTLAGLYESILDEIEQRGFDVFHERVSLSTARKLGLVARQTFAGVRSR